MGNKTIKIVEILDKRIKPAGKKNDMLVNNFCIAQLHSWDTEIVEGASLPYTCIVVEILLNTEQNRDVTSSDKVD